MMRERRLFRNAARACGFPCGVRRAASHRRNMSPRLFTATHAVIDDRKVLSTARAGGGAPFSAGVRVVRR